VEINPVSFRAATSPKFEQAIQAKTQSSSPTDTVTLGADTDKHLTYTLASLGKSGPETKDTVILPFDKPHLGANWSHENRQQINIDMQTGAFQFGDLDNKKDIDAFLKMSERLGLEQQDKMQFIKPTPEWLEKASQLDDEQLNHLVDAIYDMSESTFLSGGSREDANAIVSKLFELNPSQLKESIDVMQHLRQESKDQNNNKFRGDEFGMVSGPKSSSSLGNPLGLRHAAGDTLLKYTEMLDTAKLGQDDLSTVNKHLMQMDYEAATGLMDSVNLTEGQGREQLLSILDNNEKEQLGEMFGYIGSVTGKSSFLTQYQLEFADGRKQLATNMEMGLSDVGKRDFIQNILKVEQAIGFEANQQLIAESKSAMGNIQADIWKQLAQQVEEKDFKPENINIHSLILENTANATQQQQEKMRDDFKLSFELHGPATFRQTKSW